MAKMSRGIVWPAVSAFGGRIESKMADAKKRTKLARTSKKTAISRSEMDEEPQNCIVCFDKVVCRGKLGVCQHWFCFSCILEWSKVGCLKYNRTAKFRFFVAFYSLVGQV